MSRALVPSVSCSLDSPTTTGTVTSANAPMWAQPVSTTLSFLRCLEKARLALSLLESAQFVMYLLIMRTNVCFVSLSFLLSAQVVKQRGPNRKKQ